MKYSFSRRIMTSILWLGVAGLFVVAETLAVLVFGKLPNNHLFPGLGTKYLSVFVVALPLVAGINGYYSVRRRLSSAGDEVRSALSLQFLITIVTAYTALLVCMEPVAETLQRVLR
jgi:hypothetical protein